MSLKEQLAGELYKAVIKKIKEKKSMSDYAKNMLRIYCIKKSFPLMILSVNVTKSAVCCGFLTFNDEILNGKLHFLCSEELFTSFI